MTVPSDSLLRHFAARFESPDSGHRFHPVLLSVPGRVNLIGEHVDYHNLPVLPMAIERRLSIVFRARLDPSVRVISDGFGECQFELGTPVAPGPAGDWSNYLKAATSALATRWTLSSGIDAFIASDLPSAAGLSSSSALLTAVALALLHANGIPASFTELMAVLPEGEHFVGTRGGGMDHAAILAGRSGCALLVEFEPLGVSDVPIPDGWSFLIAHSLTTAEKSGSARTEYNFRRAAGRSALTRLGFDSYGLALRGHPLQELQALAATLPPEQQRVFLHVVEEASRVPAAVAALRSRDRSAFAQLLAASHASLRDQLQVSSPPVDALVDAALGAGAFGARLTGAGFGGAVLVFCASEDLPGIRKRLIDTYYSGRVGFVAAHHLFEGIPAAGALYGAALSNC
jgi:galactokinase